MYLYFNRMIGYDENAVNVKIINMKPQMFSDSELKDMIAGSVGPDRVPRTIRIITDTRDFFGVDYDNVVILADKHYLNRAE
jgi:hypothetical protein